MTELTMKSLPSSDRLAELFYYNSDTGGLYRRKDYYRQKAHSRSGIVFGHGYRRTKVDQVGYLEHRLVWAYHYGNIADGMFIDHVNGERDDNRIENLRLVSRAENNRNAALRKSNRSGVAGVVWYPTHNKWCAQVNFNKKRHHLGLFKNKDEAAFAVAEARNRLGYAERHGKVMEGTL